MHGTCLQQNLTMRYIIIIIITALTVVCCTPHSHTEISVDNILAQEHPDSALHLLREISLQRLNRNDRARCMLLKGLAEAHKGDTAASKESLVNAIRYFDRHGSAHEQADAWYTYAKAYMQTGNLEEAIRGYTQAAIFAEKAIGNKMEKRDSPEDEKTMTLLVAIYHTLGILYFEQGYDAVEPFAKAVEAARAKAEFNPLKQRL